ncbi:MAG: HAD-IA family hydrolase [Pseudomonadota bacterium]
MHQPKAVVFDIGNVLVRWQPERLYERLIPDAEARKAFMATSGLEAMNLEVDRGAPFRAHIYAHAATRPRQEHLIRAWHDCWPQMFQPAIEGSIALLRLLRRRGIAVHALSNFGADSFDLACTIYPVLAEFDIRVISGREGVIKPEAEIYQILEARSGLSGTDLFFTDDRAENVAAARRRGWQTHLFRNADALGLELAGLGLIEAHELPGGIYGRA